MSALLYPASFWLLAAVAQALERNCELRKQHEQRTEVEHLLAQLTPRELEVFGCLVAGLRNKEVAAELGTVEKTIQVHRSRVLHKMQVRTLAELVKIVARAGIDIASAAKGHSEHRADPGPAARPSARPSAAA